jgi:uncharacterized membrane protein
MPEKRIHQLFVASLVLKGLHALVEIAGGFALTLFSTSAILRLLDRDPHHWVARSFTPSEHGYYTFVFLSHGAINLALVVGLLRQKLWAYPATFAVLTLFIAYQLYRFSHIHDPGLIALSLLDLIVMALAWHEYQLVKGHLPTR